MEDSERLIESGDYGRARTPGNFDTFVRPVVAEFVGVMLFVFIGCLSTAWGLVPAAFAHGFTIAILIAGFGEISGGHFNPAVTLGVVLSGAMNFGLIFLYFFAQVGGALLGAAIVRGVLPSKLYSDIGGGVHHLGPPAGSPLSGDGSIKPGWAILIEMMLTTLLVLTVLMTAVNQKTKSTLAPLAIGFVVVVDILAGGNLTGASMNPARAIGPAVCASGAGLDNAFEYHYIYWVGPFLGSLFAALLYRFFFASENRRWLAHVDN